MLFVDKLLSIGNDDGNSSKTHSSDLLWTESLSQSLDGLQKRQQRPRDDAIQFQLHSVLLPRGRWQLYHRIDGGLSVPDQSALRGRSAYFGRVLSVLQGVFGVLHRDALIFRLAFCVGKYALYFRAIQWDLVGGDHALYVAVCNDILCHPVECLYISPHSLRSIHFMHRHCGIIRITMFCI